MVPVIVEWCSASHIETIDVKLIKSTRLMDSGAS
jgi:hypothetical protein